MTDTFNINYDEIYKSRGKTRQNLKIKDRKKKLAKDYINNTKSNFQSQTLNASTKNKNNDYENALIPKNPKNNKNKNANATNKKSRKTLVDKPKNLKNYVNNRVRSESPPPKKHRDRTGKNKGKPKACNFCRPEICKRMNGMVETRNEIKFEMDWFERERMLEIEGEAQQTTELDYGTPFCCNCSSTGPRNIDEMNELIEREEDQGSSTSGTQSGGTSTSEDSKEEFCESETDELNDYLKVDIEAIDKGWEVVDF